MPEPTAQIGTVPVAGEAVAADGGEQYPSPAYSWYVVAVLTLTYTVSFIDRQIMSLMIEPIRRDLHISDTQVSLLIGLAFAVFYTVLGIPIARLADRYSRRTIIAVGIAVWCFMTASCGLARNYVQLFLTRVGVGVGEAALSPSALSMMSDYFPKRTRGRAIAVYNTGITLGTGLAMIVGGSLVAHVLASPPVRLPIVGELFAWQTVFLVVGLPGLAMALLMTTVRDPQRREQMAMAGASTHLSLAAAISYPAGARRSCTAVTSSACPPSPYWPMDCRPGCRRCSCAPGRWTIREIGLAYGIVTLAAGPLAVLLASWLAERLQARGYRDAQMRSALICVGIAVLGAIGAALAPGPWVAVAMLVPASIGTTAATANGLSALMTVIPNQLRAQSAALYYLVVNVFGLTLGPTGIALFTDYVFRDTLALRYSVACISVIAGILSAILLSYNLGQYRRAFAESEKWVTGA